ncbi:hypothetical protein [Sphingomonas sp. ABOLG]|nr:hypothetical protein [Sphingomonas sp. ABOLG]
MSVAAAAAETPCACALSQGGSQSPLIRGAIFPKQHVTAALQRLGRVV